MAKRKKSDARKIAPQDSAGAFRTVPVTGSAGLTPWTVLQEAIKAVPALKYALAVLGIVSAIAIVKGFGIDFQIAVFGTIVMLILHGRACRVRCTDEGEESHKCAWGRSY